MSLTNQQLILEAVQCNHAGIKEETRDGYRKSLEHFDEYTTSVYGVSFYEVQRRHVTLYMAHLEAEGGAEPHPSRLQCAWCKQRGYPNGRGTKKGWSASSRKRSLAAVVFLYEHFAMEEDLPTMDPTAHVKRPKVIVRRGYTPTEEELNRFLNIGGSPRETLLAWWAYLAPLAPTDLLRRKVARL